MLEDLDHIGELSWGSAVLAFLYRSLSQASLKGTTNVGGFLALLQVWAWERLLPVQPTPHLEPPVPADAADHPPPDLPTAYAKKWARGVDCDIEANRLRLYRNRLDNMATDQFVWQPYSEITIAELPQWCSRGRGVWLAIVPLCCCDIVENHAPDRVLRQFGLAQGVPDRVTWDKLQFMRDERNKVDDVYKQFLEDQHALWEQRFEKVVRGIPSHVSMLDNDPYMIWFRKITRLLIGNPARHVAGGYDAYAGKHEALGRGLRYIYNIGQEIQQPEADGVSKEEWGRRICDVAAETLDAAMKGRRLSFDPEYAPVTESEYKDGLEMNLSRSRSSGTGRGRGSTVAHIDVPHDRGGGRGRGTGHRGGRVSTVEHHLCGKVEAASTSSASSTSSSSSTPITFPISWPEGGSLSLAWISNLVSVFDWASRNLPMSKLPLVLPVESIDHLVAKAIEILHEEPNCVKIDTGSDLGPDSRVVVVGDIQGQLHDMLFLLKDAGFPSEDKFFVFNGGFVDRGPWGLETFLILLAWKVFMSNRVFLLRGNHETKLCSTDYGFKKEVLTKFGDKGEHVYQKCLGCFKELPLASIICGNVYIAHGGIFRSTAVKPSKRIVQGPAHGGSFSSTAVKPSERIVQGPGESDLSLGSLEELLKANRFVLDPGLEDSTLIPGDVLWSDPSINPGLCLNKERLGVGLRWGKDCTDEFLKKFNLKLIIRSHESARSRENQTGLGGMEEGYEIDHDVPGGKLITLFSAPDYPLLLAKENGYRNKGAFIILEPPNFDIPAFHSFEAVTPRPEVEPFDTD